MEWHIITASKGGVGKTLLTLLLLTYYYENTTSDSDTSTVVIDLNAMNTDTAAMLLVGGGNIDKTSFIELPRKRKIWLRTIDTDDKIVVAYPDDPFVLYGREYFAELIMHIRDKFVNDVSDLVGKRKIGQIIIDTNYHFCNLFPKTDDYYRLNPTWVKFKDELKNDSLNIWFIWVYRQLMKLLAENNNNEVNTIIRTIGAIERSFPNRKQQLGPLIHTYAPMGLLPTGSDGSSFIGKWFFGNSSPNYGKDYYIPELKKLEELRTVGPYSGFLEWTRRLKAKVKQLEREGTSKTELDPHQQFGKILYETIRDAEDVLPINIFPIALYEAALVGYTDNEKVKNIISSLNDFDTYKKFKSLLCNKLES